MIDRKKVIHDLNEAKKYFIYVQNAQKENEKYVSVYFKAFENACTDAVFLLSEQNPVKPVRDKKTGRVWLCGNCGSYVGYEDHDENDPNEFDKFCRECGHPVSWEGSEAE